MKMSRLVAVLGVAVAGTVVVAPQSASAAANSVPSHLMGIAAVRGGLQGETTTVSWNTQTDATKYRVVVLEGAKKSEYVVPGAGATGRMATTVPTADKCSSFRITVYPENANGVGAHQSQWIGTLMPTMIVKAKAKRGADGTTATFSYADPQWAGYVGDAKMGPRLPVPYHWTVPLQIKPTLVKMVGNQVVNEKPTSVRDSARLDNLTYKNLDPKRAYVLKVSTSNGWGTCARADGKILLKAGK
ncbi:hypothetical protein ACIBSW_20205 [Actinoplanes sp. NPDC049668]|uniref:hypothetical protein n=1 Tax=unclassified Actinoplanes TaxID=2626549 RepID=UPI0033ABCF24